MRVPERIPNKGWNNAASLVLLLLLPALHAPGGRHPEHASSLGPGGSRGSDRGCRCRNGPHGCGRLAPPARPGGGDLFVAAASSSSSSSAAAHQALRVCVCKRVRAEGWPSGPAVQQLALIADPTSARKRREGDLPSCRGSDDPLATEDESKPWPVTTTAAVVAAAAEEAAAATAAGPWGRNPSRAIGLDAVLGSASSATMSFRRSITRLLWEKRSEGQGRAGAPRGVCSPHLELTW